MEITREDRQRAIENYNLGLARAKRGDYQEAVELLEKVLEINPDHLNAYNVLGKVYFHRRQVEKARECWQRVLEIDPDNFTARMCLEALYKEEGHWVRSRVAIAALVLILIVGGILLPFLVNQNRIQLPLAAQSSRQGESTENHLRALEIQLSKLSPLESNLTMHLEAMGGKIESIEAELSSLQGDLKRLFEEGVHREAAQSEKVQTGKGILISEAEMVERDYERAIYYFFAGRYEDARQLLQKLPFEKLPLRLQDNLFFWAGKSLYEQKKYAESAETFKRVVEKYPKGDKAPESKMMMAFSYGNLGEKKKAVALLRELLKEKLPSDQTASVRKKIEEWGP